MFVRECGVPERELAVVLVDYLGGCAKEEALRNPDEVRCDFGALASLLRRVFGPWETVTSLYAEFYSRMQSVGETLAEYCRALIRLNQRIEGIAPTVAERHALVVHVGGALKHQFVVSVCVMSGCDMLRSADKSFIVVCEEALYLMCEEKARIMQMRPVEKAAPVLSGPVGGSVSYGLGVDAVVLRDRGVSSGAVGRYVSAGDVSLSDDGDTDGSGVDTVVSGAVSVCMCDLDRVSRGDIVMSVDDMSLQGGGGAMVSGVDESACGVNSVLAAGVLGVDTVVSGVGEPVCGVNSVLAPGVLDLCGVDKVLTGVDESVCGVNSVMSAGVDLCGVDTVVPAMVLTSLCVV